MLKKVLVANRGEIAVRIARACRELNVRAVMVYSDADRSALHVRSGDEAHHLGGSAASDSYLRGNLIINIALAAGCDAVHPGYGFLAENAQFARDVQSSGLVWIGPAPDAITLMGSKRESKRLAQAIGIPIVPGYFGEDQSDKKLAEEADRIGYPVLVKASAGGGGKGMRIVNEPMLIEEALAGSRREASAAFGDDALMIEKYLPAPRHIEVQVFGDQDGDVMHLGERDCTIQRRHQKVVEESPSPVIDEEIRDRITSAALKLARAAKYTNAGTVEFIFQDGEFYFLEMNTRIQVEHPVTEEALGVDLVQAQIRVAGGEKLHAVLPEQRLKGHAIEARLYAEDPRTGFLPSIGKLHQLRLPAPSRNVRLDSGVSAGDSVTAFYDPMLAKIITSGEDRNDALTEMRNALNAVEVSGPETNIEFLRWLFAQPDFASAQFSTRYIEERYTPGEEIDVPLPVLLACAGEMFNGTLSSTVPSNPWLTVGWRLGRQNMPISVIADGRRYRVVLSATSDADNLWSYEMFRGDAHINSGQAILRTLSARGAPESTLAVETPDIEGSGSAIVVITQLGPGSFEASFGGLRHYVRRAEPLSADNLQTQLSALNEDTLESPMPGKILKVLVSPGDTVTKDQPLIIIEAMKMEFTVRAPHDGKVATVTYSQGAQVAVGDVLVEMARER